jgi:LysM repeat protein
MWQDGIDVADSRWDVYDDIIRSTVDRYNAHLARTTEGYYRLDWKLVKAMAWTETGGAPDMGGSFIAAGSDPRANIEAGVGYLLTRMALTAIRNVPEPGSPVYDVTVQAGDSLNKIARAEGSTEAMLRQLNLGVVTLKIGQVLKCQKAAMKRVVTGWRPFNTTSIAIYNGGGDPRYREKLDYTLRAMSRQRVR